MPLSRRVDSLPEAADVIADGRTVCCIGVFDGVHLGHQRLIGSAVAQARRRDKQSVVLTFRNHPLSVLAPAYAPPLLTDPAEKARRLAALRPSLVVMIPFDHAFGDQEPESFIEAVLVRQLRAVSVWCGRDFRFGREGRGDIGLLEQCGRAFGLEAHTIEPVRLRNHTVSSTWVRSLIDEGQVEQAAECMDRPHVVCGEVIAGHQRGAALGYPTANMQPPPGIVLPGDGIYAVRVQVGRRRYGGMMHVGPVPTFDIEERRFEVHLFDFSGNLLGKTVAVDFIARLRGIERFASPDELIAQIRADERQARRVLNLDGKR